MKIHLRAFLEEVVDLEVLLLGVPRLEEGHLLEVSISQILARQEELV